MSATDAPAAAQHAYNLGFAHLIDSKYYILASSLINIYDLLLTFDDEVKYIWQAKISLPSCCFFVFRYVPPVVSIVNFFADHDPRFVGSVCKNWIWLPVTNAPIVSASTGVILVLRVYAIYNRATWVLIFLTVMFLGEIGVMLWSVPGGSPAILPPGWVGCIPSKKPGTGDRLSVMFIAALVFDSSIFILTLGRSIYLRLRNSTIGLVQLIVRDGIIYFFVIFIVNALNVFLLTLAPDDLGAINTPFASLIASTMVARLMFNLRAASRKNQHISGMATIRTTQISDVGEWQVQRRTAANSTFLASAGGASFIGMDEFDAPLDGGWSTQPEPTAVSSEEAKSGKAGSSQQIELESLQDAESHA
ncbi:hypothetical protein EW146_g8487 [Bondarzewia mesenterica]|uniref:DUF6533 domain-containing protein n=1 Tax=Bondarzewia mesenterica TaxID=1095465 RepID=A0A4S4LDZ3_9AGAM|nr:hypothetical protein EW146_g8487 [Bondarzewia mesenterica]